MAVQKRELAFVAERPGVDAGEWWHLVYDPEVPGIYVERTRLHENRVDDTSSPGDADRYGLNDFLTLAGDGPAKSALMTALGDMFRER